MKVNATSRSKEGSSASRRLRRAGRVPAILYGGNNPAQSIEIDHNEIYHLLRRDEFHSSILDINLDDKKESALLRSVQWHPYKQQVLHVDFQRVSANDPITTRVPLEVLNADTSPAVQLEQQVVSLVSTDLLITCLPANLPTVIEIDVATLEANGNVYLSEIKLPEGVEYAGTEEDPVLVAALGRRGPSADEIAEEEEEGEEGSADAPTQEGEE